MRADDRTYMALAIVQALKAKGKTSPNPLVGALLIKEDRIIAGGYHRRCGADHAEAVVLKKAGIKAKGGKLIVTLEPCGHFGRTPPCVDMIIRSGVKEVVIGMKDPNPLNNGKSIRKLKRAGIKVRSGVLQRDCRRINEPFIKFMQKKMPYVVAKCAQTIDGKSALACGRSQWITQKKTRDFAKKKRLEFDAICAGIKTVCADNPRLNAPIRSKRIKKVIIDSTLKIPLRARLFQGTKPQDIIIAATRRVDKQKLQALRKKGVQVIICPGNGKEVPLKYIFKELAKRQIAALLLEGGPRLIGSALKENCVDAFHIYVAMKIAGDQEALSSIRGLQIKNIGQLIHLKEAECQRIGEDLFIQGYVRRYC